MESGAYFASVMMVLVCGGNVLPIVYISTIGCDGARSVVIGSTSLMNMLLGLEVAI